LDNHSKRGNPKATLPLPDKITNHHTPRLLSGLLSLSKLSKMTICNESGNGRKINLLFKAFTKVKTQEQLDALKEKIAHTKFGTYFQYSVLDAYEKLKGGNANAVIRRDFLDFCKRAIEYYTPRPKY
jgi:hypothetical protein